MSRRLRRQRPRGLARFFPFAAVIGGSAASSSVISRIQQGTITIGAAATSNTATITSVVTANSILIYNGLSSTTTGAGVTYHRSATRIDLTNATTVTATRANSTDAVTVSFTVIEFASGVNSIQQGTITITAGGTSNTATVSAVGATAFVLYLGMTQNDSGGATSYVGATGSVVLTNSTTVTANVPTLGADAVVGYMVVDLGASIVASIEAQTATNVSGNAAWTDTITSVTTTQTLLFWNGSISSPKTALPNSFANTLELTNATTATNTRAGTSTTSQTIYYTVVTLAAAALNGNIQRGTIALSAAASATATISSVDTTKSAVIWGNFRVTNNNQATDLPRLDLTNATTVTATVNTAGSPTAAYQVVQFA